MLPIIDWAYFQARWLPASLRSAPVMADWLSVLTSFLRMLYGQVFALDAQLRQDYGGSGQRLVLERLLRNELSNNGIRVVLLDKTQEELILWPVNNYREPIDIYQNDELAGGAVLPIYLYPHQSDEAYDFKVQVPTDVYAGWPFHTRRKLATLIDRFKVYGSTYLIETY